jgi:hypothetical protein
MKSYDATAEIKASPVDIWRSMPDLGPSFRQFATGLKQRAER